MDDHLANVISEHFCDRLGVGEDEAGRELAGLIGHALRALPHPDEWLTNPERTAQEVSPAALLLVGDRLIEVSIERNDDAVRVLLTRNLPLANAGVVVETVWGGRETFGEHGIRYQTETTLKHAHGPGTLIRGLVQIAPSEGLDPGEQFARAAAGRVGKVLGTTTPAA
jgi:hypothetical protein